MSTQVGKAMRLKRVIDPAGVSVICALDHGMTAPTFLEPLAEIGSRTAEAVAGDQPELQRLRVSQKPGHTWNNRISSIRIQ